MKDKPIAYFITFTTYGTWFHGDQRGSIIKQSRVTEILKFRPNLKISEAEKLKHSQVFLNKQQRKVVLKTIIDHCSLKKWKLFAAHVLHNHVYVLVYADIKVEKIMADFKAWATRKLRETGFEAPKVWTRHGSTIYIFNHNVLLEKIDYVIDQQPAKMEYFKNDINI